MVAGGHHEHGGVVGGAPEDDALGDLAEFDPQGVRRVLGGPAGHRQHDDLVGMACLGEPGGDLLD